MSATSNRASSASTSARAAAPWRSVTDGLSRRDLLGVDLLERRALGDACALPLCRVRAGDAEVRRRPELVRDRLHPLDQLLDPRARRYDLAALEVEQIAGEAEADRAPEVLLEQPPRPVRQRLAVVDRARDPRRERVDQRGERLRLAEIRLCVADPHLDRG